MNTFKKYWYVPTIVLTVCVLIWALWQIPRWQAQSYRSRIEPHIQKYEERIQLEKEFDTIENSSRTTLAQIIAGIVVLLGLYMTFQNLKVARQNAEIALKNVNIAEEGKITDRFSKAVEMLGSEQLEVRLGGIYALERIARDSQKDHWTVMEVLTAFVRENSHKKLEENKDSVKRNVFIRKKKILYQSDSKQKQLDEKPREDIQAIMTAIGRRKWVDSETQRLNLVGVNLKKLNLTELNFRNAFLSKANLSRAVLSRAVLSGAILSEAVLSEAVLSYANLSEAILSEAVLTYANLSGAILSGAILFYADLSGAILLETNLSKAELFRAKLFRADLGRAVLSEADLGLANLEEADLRDSRYLSLKQILSAENFNGAILPPELEKELKEWQERQNKEKADVEE